MALRCDPDALRAIISGALARRVPHGDVVDYHPDGTPRTATLKLADVTELALDALYSVGVDHVYLSTACLHMTHGECRRRCKFCDMACACSCHLFTRLDELAAH